MNIVGKITTVAQSAPNRLNSLSYHGWWPDQGLLESLETPGAVVEGRDLHHDSGIESLR